MKAMDLAWGTQLRETYGFSLPDDYLTFDFETTGTNLHEDLPIEAGHCIVRGREVTQRGSFAINWGLLLKGSRRRWFFEKVEKIAYIMRKQGTWRLDVDYIRKHGRAPHDVMGFYSKLFHANRAAKAFFAGHYAWRFDVPLAEQVIDGLDLPEFYFGPNEVLDTGGMEKAAQIDRPPFPDETMETYFRLIADRVEKGVFWSLPHCIEKYDFASRYGVDPVDSHQAEADAYCCHLLYEEHRPDDEGEAPF